MAMEAPSGDRKLWLAVAAIVIVLLAAAIFYFGRQTKPRASAATTTKTGIAVEGSVRKAGNQLRISSSKRCGKEVQKVLVPQ